MDHIFLLTEKLFSTVLAWDPVQKLRTVVCGSVYEKVGRPVDGPPLGSADISGNWIGLQLHTGLLKMVPISEGISSVDESFNVRIDELNVIDFKFLEERENVNEAGKFTLIVLYEDQRRYRHLKTYQLVLEEKDLVETGWSESSVDADAKMLIPLSFPATGVAVLGSHSVSYYRVKPFNTSLSGSGSSSASSANDMHKAQIPNGTVFECWGKIDACRYLLGDEGGVVSMAQLILNASRTEVVDIRVTTLGETAIPSALCYLDNGFVFVGSCYGDSSLVKLSPVATSTGSYLEVMDIYPSIGPIVDMVLLDSGSHGQGSLVTCSGFKKDGSLRLIRNGIGLHESACIELEGIEGLWSVKKSIDDDFDYYLVQSYVGETRLLAIDEEASELVEVEVRGWEENVQTILVSNVLPNHLLQVSAKEARFVSSDQKTSWKFAAEAGTSFLLAASVPSAVALTTSRSKLLLLQPNNDGNDLWCERVSQSFSSEISALSIFVHNDCHYVIVGLWDNSVRLFSFHSDYRFVEVLNIPLEGDMMARSVTYFAASSGESYIFAGLADGSLCAVELALGESNVSMLSTRKFAVGTIPLRLYPLRLGGEESVFVCCDRPTIVHCASSKLHFSNVNLKEVSHTCSFNTVAFPLHLAVASQDSLRFGTIDDIQKLHIRSHNLKEMPNRICSHASSGSIVISSLDFGEGSDEETCWIRLHDDQTLSQVASYSLKPGEWGQALCSGRLDDSQTEYVVVGTSFVETENEPSTGRLLVFSIEEGRFVMLHEAHVDTGVNVVVISNGKLFVASRAKLHLYEWQGHAATGTNTRLECLSSVGSFTWIIGLKVVNDYAVVCDLMKSISLVVYSPLTGALEVAAEEVQPQWTTAVEFVEEDIYVVGENNFNLYVCRRNADSASEDERRRLSVEGEFHLGDYVNTFRPGSLVIAPPDADTESYKITLIGCKSGAIYSMISLSSEKFQALTELQQAIATHIHPVGGLPYSDWRSFASNARSKPSQGFVDGDMVELYLDLPLQTQQAVAQQCQMTLEQCLSFVEEMHRLH